MSALRFFFQFVLSGWWSVATMAQTPPTTPNLPRTAPTTATEAIKSLKMHPGYRITLVASEPQVVDPVAMSFDEQGRLFVAEMRDYSERRAERLSRVRCLRDQNKDGTYETATTYVEGLAWATGVLWHEGWVYVAATPDLWRCRDLDGDGVAEEKEVIFTGFGAGAAKLNVQALFNSLTVGPDGRIYVVVAGNGARLQRVEDGKPKGEVVILSGRDFSFDPETLEVRAEIGGGQFGQTFDHFGRRYTCSNSRHIIWIDPPPQGAGRRLPWPSPLVDIPIDGPAATVFRTSPEEPWRVVRTQWRGSGVVPGIVEGNGRASGYFTSASGIHQWEGQFFIGDVGSNLVHRKALRETPDGPMAERVAGEEKSEFLTSTDPWFRPVAFATGPDKTLYVADMYREVIEHPDSLPPALKSQLDLNSGNDRGRIWRIVREDSHPAPLLARPIHSLDQVRAASGSDKVDKLVSLWKSAPSQGASSRLAQSILARLDSDEEVKRFFDAVKPSEVEAVFDLLPRLKLKLPQAIAEEARRRLLSEALPEASRLKALHALGGESKELAKDLMLATSTPAGLKTALLKEHPHMAPSILGAWHRMPTSVRQVAVELLAARDEGVEKLLTAVEAKTIRANEIPTNVVALMRKNPGLAERCDQAFGPLQVDRSAVVAKRLPALNLVGDKKQGETLFQALCAQCHRMDSSQSRTPGPDLTSMASKGPPLLLVAILDPNREVAPAFNQTQIITRSGETLTGVLVSESPEQVVITLPGGLEKSFPRADVASITQESRSLMPEGLEAALTDQQLADIMSFIQAPTLSQPK